MRTSLLFSGTFLRTVIFLLLALQWSIPASRVQAANLLNVDFTAHLNPAFTRKVGPAVVGQSANDVWNVYSRDVSSMWDWRDSGQVANLRWADGSGSGSTLNVSNAAGAWATDSLNPMLKSYLYPLGRTGNIEVLLNNLPSGVYQLYFYAHGQTPPENAVVHVVSGNHDYGNLSTSSDPAWDARGWIAGQQFVHFDAIEVNSSQSIQITVQPGQSGLPVINGLQLLNQSDGIPAAWRQQYFGADFATNPSATATADPDGDGANNYQEFFGGTNPLDAGSVQSVPTYVSTFAGSSAGGQDGYRTQATFFGPGSLTFDPQGRLWVVEATLTGYTDTFIGGHRVRRMDANGVFTTVAGSAEPGYVDGPGPIARFAGPNSIAFDHQGNAFVVDRANHRIRKIDPNGVVSTFAGSQRGYQDGVGVQAFFDTPIWIASDSADNLYVADWFNLRIRKITPTAVVTTYAGGARGAQDGSLAVATFNSPNGLAFAPDGSLFVSDWANGLVRKIKDGRVTTFASGLGYTDGVTVDQSGNVYATASGSQFLAKYSPDGRQSWTIPLGQGYQDGPISVAKFSSIEGPPTAMAGGNFLTVDWSNNRIREITVGVPPLLVIDPPGGTFTDPILVHLTTTVAGGVIYYTADGGDPTLDSKVYSNSITLQDSTSLRARLFVNGVPISATVSAIFTRAGAAQCASSPSDLVAWWPGENNGADRTVGDPGALVGIRFQPGKVGAAFALDGKDSHVNFGSAPKLNVGPGPGFSIETWISPSEIQDQIPILEWNSGRAYGAHFYVSVILPYGRGPGCLYANLVDTTGTDHVITSPAGVIKPNQFQHVALTYNRTTGEAALYADGALLVTQNLGIFVPQTSYDLLLGYRPPGFDGGPFAFSGLLDEVSLYNRALTPAEIVSIYLAGSAGKCLPGAPAAVAFGLQKDWSDTQNPNGPWTFRAGTAVLPRVTEWKLDAFNPPQGGWAFDSTIPFWFRSSSPPPAPGDDWQIGDILVHTHAPGTPNGGDNGLANVTWTSPISGTIQITGGVWEARDFFSPSGGLRGNRWNLYVKNSLISTGTIGGGDLFSRAKPFPFDLGSAGPSALQNISIAAGDIVELEFVPTSFEGDYVGVRLNITATAPATTATGLLAYWSFDETNGTVAHDVVGQYDGSLSDGAHFVAGGIAGNALSLSRASNGFVSMGQVLNLTNTPFSVVAWVKTNPGDTSENMVVASKHEAFVNNGFFLDVNQSNSILGQQNKAMFFAGDPDRVPVSTTSVNDGNWHQIVGVHELNGNNWVYVDGSATATTVPSLPVISSPAAFLIGGASYGGQPQGLFTGLIDEVQVYGRAVLPSEIDYLFAHRTPLFPTIAQVSTLAGSGSPAFADGLGISASFNAPNAGAVDSEGKAWIADTRNHSIRQLDLQTGLVTTVAGTGAPGYLDGPARTALFSSPLAAIADRAGNVFIADTDNNRIRSLSSATLRPVVTVAGNGTRGYLDGPAAQAEFDFPNDLVVDDSGFIYVTEFNNHTVRKISPNGLVTTLAGNGKPGYAEGAGPAAGLNQPAGLALDKNGDLYLTEWGSHRIRKITAAGQTTTFCGSVFPGFLDGSGLNARFFQPDGIVVTPSGIIYVADHGNNAIRRISTDGTVTTVAGTGASGFLDGPADKSKFNAPSGIGIDSLGNLIVADTGNNRIRIIRLSTGSVQPGPISPIEVDRQLPTYYAPGSPLLVRLQVRVVVGNGSSFTYAIADTPPQGWTVGSIDTGGTYDATRNTIKFGPFLDQSARSVSYQLTPPLGQNGTAIFQGIVSVDGSDSTIGGSAAIQPPPAHPADLSPSDFRITINETTAYASAWRNGRTWAVGPSPIPIDYVTRAGLLWKRGETYRFDSGINTPPLWWTSASGTMPLIASVQTGGAALTNSVAAILPAAFIPGEPFTIHLIVTPASAASAYAVEYGLPDHLTVTSISDSGEIASVNPVIRWGPFFDSSPRNLFFTAVAPATFNSSLVFNGEASFDGVTQPITGSSLVRAALRLSSLRLLSNNEFGLEVGEPDGLQYQIETSTNLQTWKPLGVSTNLDGLLRFTDSQAHNSPQRFYRASGD